MECVRGGRDGGLDAVIWGPERGRVRGGGGVQKRIEDQRWGN